MDAFHGNHNRPNCKKLAAIPDDLMERVEQYISCPVSVAKSKRQLIEMAVVNFLDREEIVNVQMEKELQRVREAMQLR
jgi:hypothetical protein